MPGPEQQHHRPVDGDQVAVAMELNQQTKLLATLVAAIRAGTLEVGVGDYQPRQLVLDQFPVPGARRALAYRPGAGNDSVAVPASPAGVLAVSENAGRLGGLIVNSGASAVILYLSADGKPTPGKPAIWLPANGSWNFVLGHVVWSGNVSAVGQGGASSLTVAEV